VFGSVVGQWPEIGSALSCQQMLAFLLKLEMWVNTQHDGRPAEYRWVCSTPQSLADAHY